MNPGRRLTALCALLPSLLAVPAHAAALSFALQSNDVVVLAGGANLERTRFNGYLQTQLIAANPAQPVRLRNLAWEGDTVFEHWRDDGKDQWRRPRDWKPTLASLGATVVLAQFGQMESLNGAAKLGDFVKAYEKLLDEFEAQIGRAHV